MCVISKISVGWHGAYAEEYYSAVRPILRSSYPWSITLCGSLWIAWVLSCPCCLLDATIVLHVLPVFYLCICLCWPQAPCLKHHAVVLHSAVLLTTAAASSPTYHISTNVVRRQPLPPPAWIHITMSISQVQFNQNIRVWLIESYMFQAIGF